MKPTLVIKAVLFAIGLSTPVLAQVDIRDVENMPYAEFELNDITNPDSKFYRSQGTFSSSKAQNAVIEQAARGVGIRAGFAAEADKINQVMMKQYRRIMDRHYNFKGLLLQNGNVVPPVITQIQGVRELPNSRYLYTAQVQYEIVKEPRLTTLPPSWMDYALLPVRSVRPPTNIELSNNAEKALWADAAEAGWEEGTREARRAYIDAMNILDRDYQGMRLYHGMAQRGDVSIPRVNIASQKTRIDENGRRAFVNERVVQLVAGSRFQIRR